MGKDLDSLSGINSDFIIKPEEELVEKKPKGEFDGSYEKISNARKEKPQEREASPDSDDSPPLVPKKKPMARITQEQQDKIPESRMEKGLTQKESPTAPKLDAKSQASHAPQSASQEKATSNQSIKKETGFLDLGNHDAEPELFDIHQDFSKSNKPSGDLDTAVFSDELETILPKSSGDQKGSSNPLASNQSSNQSSGLHSQPKGKDQTSQISSLQDQTSPANQSISPKGSVASKEAQTNLASQNMQPGQKASGSTPASEPLKSSPQSIQAQTAELPRQPVQATQHQTAIDAERPAENQFARSAHSTTSPTQQPTQNQTGQPRQQITPLQQNQNPTNQEMTTGFKNESLATQANISNQGPKTDSIKAQVTPSQNYHLPEASQAPASEVLKAQVSPTQRPAESTIRQTPEQPLPNSGATKSHLQFSDHDARAQPAAVKAQVSPASKQPSTITAQHTAQSTLHDTTRSSVKQSEINPSQSALSTSQNLSRDLPKDLPRELPKAADPSTRAALPQAESPASRLEQVSSQAQAQASERPVHDSRKPPASPTVLPSAQPHQSSQIQARPAQEMPSTSQAKLADPNLESQVRAIDTSDQKVTTNSSQKKSKDSEQEVDEKGNAQVGVTSDSAPSGVTASSSTTQVSRSAEIQEIISQMVDELSTLTRSDRSETMLTLSKPPAFKGAQIVISEFKSAKGEFNVSFNNLSKEALEVIGARINGDALRQGLEQKGFTLHIIQFSEQSFTQMSQGDTFGQDSRGQSDGRESGSDGGSGSGSQRDGGGDQQDGQERQEWQEF